MMQKCTGYVHKYGDNINTDIITPGKYMELDIREMAEHAMEGVDPSFSSKVSPGDILVARNNFGSGSSRETAPLALKAAGISAVIAVSFARIFYRNAINIGLPVLELAAGDIEAIGDGDLLRIDLAEGKVHDVTCGREFSFAPIPERLLQMLSDGGLTAQLEKRIEREEV